MEIKKILQASFPSLKDSSLTDRICENSSLLEFESGITLLKSGEFISAIPMVVDGAIKVSRENNLGQEVFLYFMRKGETCAMTLSSCLKQQKSAIRATTMCPTQILLIPHIEVAFYMRNFANWNEFILDAFHNRFDSIVGAFERASFMSLEDQLRIYLRDIVAITENKIVNLSHEELAMDLGSSRVVVSRVLKIMEQKGWLQLKRGRLVIESSI